MQAVVYTEYGAPDVLQLKEVEAPTPKANEVRVRVHASPVNIGDLWARNFKAMSPAQFSMPTPLWLPVRIAFGYNKPKKRILGNEFSGVVESVGSAVTTFKAGDAVFGYRGQNFGAYAEFMCMPETGLIALKPTNMTFEEAAAVPYGALMALTLLRRVNIQPGHKVLINGASGNIGSAALQLTKYYGAEVTAVCSTPRLELVRALGADKIIDYTREDFTKNGEKYDLIFDILNKSSFARCKNSLTANGSYLLASFKMKQLGQMLWTSVNGGRKVICALSNEKQSDLEFIKTLIESGRYKAVVDRCYPLEQAAEAHRYVEAGSRTGSVIISVAPMRATA